MYLDHTSNALRIPQYLVAKIHLVVHCDGVPSDIAALVKSPPSETTKG